jgi:signal transduction histidine kinase
MTETWRLVPAAGVAVVVVAAAVAATPGAGVRATVPGGLVVVLTLELLVLWPRLRPLAPVVAGVAAAASLVASASVIVMIPRPGGQPAGVWGMVEVGALVVLTFLVVRFSPVRQALLAGALSGLAVAIAVLRFIVPSSPFEAVALCAFWGLGAIGAAAVAGYLRRLEERRRRAVVEARRAQRLVLARDLHDFVAHDVSEMVAQAQAARLVAADSRVDEALRRIERAGLDALASLDRTVHMLHDGSETAPEEPLPGLADLPRLAARFEAAGSARVDVALDPALDGLTPREVATTAYRIVVEALTNVRRHAPAATAVAISLRAEGGELRVTVTNDGVAAPVAGGRRGGRGLPGLEERVGALGGALTAGAADSGCWRLTATLPLP